MQVAQEYLDEVDERITRMATALPGGLALRGGTCGILLGALAAVGLKYGSVKRSERQLSGKLGLRVYDFFQELTRGRYGTINCRDISRCDFTNPEEASAYLGSAAQKDCAALLVEAVSFCFRSSTTRPKSNHEITKRGALDDCHKEQNIGRALVKRRKGGEGSTRGLRSSSLN